MSIPAIVIAGPKSHHRIAGLSLLERQIVAAHRANCGPIIVVSKEPLPKFRRTSRLGIVHDVREDAPVISGPHIRIDADVLVSRRDVERVRAQESRLVDDRGVALGVVHSHAKTPGPPRDLSAGRGTLRVVNARDAERALWSSFDHPVDGLMDRFIHRPLGAPLARVLVRTPVTPNQITIFATLVGLSGGVFLAQGERPQTVLGAFLFVLSALFDCLDGDVARATFQESRLGKWLDFLADQVVHLGVFLGIALGVSVRGAPTEAVVLGTLLIVGAVLSFLVILKNLLEPPEHRRPKVQRLIDRTTNRDFAYLVLLLAALDALLWFLVIAALGSHVFWILAAWARRSKPPRREPLP